MKRLVILTILCLCSPSITKCEELRTLLSREIDYLIPTIETLQTFNDGENIFRLNKEFDSRRFQNPKHKNSDLYTISGQHIPDGEIGKESCILYLPTTGEWRITRTYYVNNGKLGQYKPSVTFKLECRRYDTGKMETYTFHTTSYGLTKDNSSNPEQRHGVFYYPLPQPGKGAPSWAAPDIIRTAREHVLEITKDRDRLRIFRVREEPLFSERSDTASQDTLYFSIMHSLEGNKLWGFMTYALIDIYFVEVDGTPSIGSNWGDMLFTVIHRTPYATDTGKTKWTYKKLLIDRTWGSIKTKDLGPIPQEQWKPEWSQLPQQLENTEQQQTTISQ